MVPQASQHTYFKPIYFFPTVLQYVLNCTFNEILVLLHFFHNSIVCIPGVPLIKSCYGSWHGHLITIPGYFLNQISLTTENWQIHIAPLRSDYMALPQYNLYFHMLCFASRKIKLQATQRNRETLTEVVHPQEHKSFVSQDEEIGTLENVTTGH